MKKALAAALALALSLGMSMTAMAADSPVKGTVGVGAMKPDGTVIENPLASTPEDLMQNEGKKEIVQAADTKAKEVIAELAKTNAALAGKTAEVAAVIDVTPSAEVEDIFAAGGKVTLTFTVAGFKMGDTVVILHYNTTTNQWENIDDAKVVNDDTVQGTFTSLSPIAIAKAVPDTTTSNPPADDNKPTNNPSNGPGNVQKPTQTTPSQGPGSQTTPGTSPKTGDMSVAGIMALVALCGAGIVAVNRKKTA